MAWEDQFKAKDVDVEVVQYAYNQQRINVQTKELLDGGEFPAILTQC